MVEQIGVRPTAEVASDPGLMGDLAGFGLTLVVIGIVFFIIILILKWVFSKATKTKDIYDDDYKRTIELCKIHKKPKFIKSIMGLPQSIASKGVPVMIRYPSLDYSKQYVVEENKEANKPVNKNTKITNNTPEVVKEEIQSNLETQDELTNRLEESINQLSPGETYKLGNYAGSCFTQDGCFNILVKSANYKILGVFPKLLVVKLRMRVKQRTLDNNKEKTTSLRDIPPDSFSLSEDIIIVDSLGLDNMGKYYYAVNMDENGYVVNTREYIYHDISEIAMQRQLIDVGRNMAIVAEDWVRTNPLVQFVRKTDSGRTGD